MMRETMQKMTECRDIKHMFIDFADGALGDAEAAMVLQHVERCGACQAELAALQRSLAFAQAIWQETAAYVRTNAADGRPMDRRRERRRLPLAWAACGAAAVMVVVLCWKFLPTGAGPEVVHQRTLQEGSRAYGGVENSAATSGRIQTGSIATGSADMEAFIRHEEQASRLATSIRILADAPNVEHDVARAEGYLRTAYGTRSSHGRQDEVHDLYSLDQGT